EMVSELRSGNGIAHVRNPGVRPAAGLVAAGLVLLLSGQVVGPALFSLGIQDGMTEDVRGWVMIFSLLSVAGAVCLCIGLFRMVAKIDELYDRPAQVQEAKPEGPG